jgi:putative oxidoreductase
MNMNTLNEFGPLLDRILIAVIYLVSGFEKIIGFQGTVGTIATKSLPLPQLAAISAIIVDLGGGTMLVIAWNARWAAVALFVFTAVAELIFHNFWAAPQ